MWALFAKPAANLGHDLVDIGMLAGRGFGMDKFAIHGDFMPTA